LERNAVKLKAAPIRSVEEEGGASPEKKGIDTAKGDQSRGWFDPHRTGFGKNPITPVRVRSPPRVKVVEGILGEKSMDAWRDF